MARKVIYCNEMQDPDILTAKGDTVVDDTEWSERIMYIDPKVDTEVICVWEYFRHRIPAMAISDPPSFASRDSIVSPVPLIDKVELLPDRSGIRFVIKAGAKEDDSWMLNAQVSSTYFNEEAGRTYTHYRNLQAVIVSTKEKTEDYVKRVYPE